MQHDMIVEIHRHFSPAVRLTPNEVVSVVWTSSISPAHGEATITIASAASRFDQIIPGDWVVIRDKSGATVFFGRVTDTTDSLSIGRAGVVMTTNVSFRAQSWIDLFSRVQVFAPDGALDVTVGTLYTKKDWARVTSSIVGDFSRGKLGFVLQLLIKQVFKVKLPETLGGFWLSDLITVIYDEPTRLAWAPEMVIEELPTAGAFPNQISFLNVKSHIYEFVRSLFVPEPNLIDLFPYLAKPTSLSVLTPMQANLYDILGVSLTLIYRIKPWRTKPLGASVFASSSATDGYRSAEKTLAEKVAAREAKMFPGAKSAITSGVAWASQLAAVVNETPVNAIVNLASAQLLSGYFNKVTWSREYFVKIPTSTVIGLTRGRSDSMRTNCSFVNLAVLDVEAVSRSGLPIRIDSEIENHGLRAATPTWPFIIRPSEKALQLNFIQYMRTIAAQIMQFYHKGHIFGSGTISCAGGPARLPDGNIVVPAIAGKPIIVEMPEGYDPFIAYCESVEHAVSTEEAVVVSRTTINYSRGLYGSDEDSFRDTAIPVQRSSALDRIFGFLKGFSGGSSFKTRKVRKGASNPIPDPLSDCKDGRPVTSFPKNQLFSITPPAWLRDWVLSRILVEREFDIVARYWDSPDSDLFKKHNIMVLAACMYVIHKFWRLKSPTADVFIASWIEGRDGSTHPEGAAVDFFVSLSGKPDGEENRVPVLQNWNALNRLIAEKRIPSGGRGLYLNVDPATGVTGVTPEAAGKASGAWSPPGGTTATHYDIRKHFGAGMIAPGGADGTTWIWLDHDGDGKSEYRLHDPHSADEVFASLRDDDFRRDLRNYWSSGAALKVTDTYLPQVDSTVPNAMQVLGLEGWCVAPEAVADGGPTGLHPIFDKEMGAFIPALDAGAQSFFVFTSDRSVVPETALAQGIVEPYGESDVPAEQKELYGEVMAGESAMKTPCRMMLRYFAPLIGKCHLYISSDNKVPSEKVYEFVKNSAERCGIASFDSLEHNLYFFSNGATAALNSYNSDLGDKIKTVWMVDFPVTGQPTLLVECEKLSKKYRAASHYYYTSAVGGGTWVLPNAPKEMFAASAVVEKVEAPTPPENPFDDLLLHISANKAAMARIRRRLSGVTDKKPSTQSSNTRGKLYTSEKYGKLQLLNNESAPFIAVYGGIPVDGVQSGVYMYDYIGPLQDLAHIYVAKNNRIDGYPNADGSSFKWYEPLLPKAQGRTNVLFMFSGGQNPGQALNLNYFQKIFLSDIYLDSATSSGYWVPAVQANPSKFVFVYTELGGQFAKDARAALLALPTLQRQKVSPLSGESFKLAHMRCNAVTVDLALDFITGD